MKLQLLHSSQVLSPPIPLNSFFSRFWISCLVHLMRQWHFGSGDDVPMSKPFSDRCKRYSCPNSSMQKSSPGLSILHQWSIILFPAVAWPPNVKNPCSHLELSQAPDLKFPAVAFYPCSWDWVKKLPLGQYAAMFLYSVIF